MSTTTIVIFCRNDNELREASRKIGFDGRYNIVSGARRAALVTVLKKLKGGDKVIFSAHGNSQEIGDSEGSNVVINATQLAELIRGHVTNRFSGEIYFSTCNGHAFGVNLLNALDYTPSFRVFGHPRQPAATQVNLSEHQQC